MRNLLRTNNQPIKKPRPRRVRNLLRTNNQPIIKPRVRYFLHDTGVVDHCFWMSALRKIDHVQLPARQFTRSKLVFHGSNLSTKGISLRWQSAGCIKKSNKESTSQLPFHNPGVGTATRSFSLYLDLAGARFEFSVTHQLAKKICNPGMLGIFASW